MKKILFILLTGIVMFGSGCQSNTYSNLRNKEKKLIENYIRFNDIDFGGSLHTAVVKSDVCKFLKISKSKFYRDRKALLIELGIRKDSC
jgi:hypothetical protein